ncbi:MAG: endolytic transglycosylase MltG [Deltaproteobacteria bacterium]|nr:endolytic transglycosylase MltG [Deltaproteobacteria bacterium]
MTLLGLVAIAAAVFLLVAFPRMSHDGTGVRRTVDVPPGTGPRALAGILTRAGATSSPRLFALWLKLDGRMPRVRSGRFLVPDTATPEEIVGILTARGGGLVRVTIPEGFSLSRVAGAFEEAGLFHAKDVRDALRDRTLLGSLGIPGPSAEGFLFPDTYFIDPSRGPKDALAMMHEGFVKRVIAGLFNGRPPKDLLAVVTLASIVQAEAADASEMPVIAGVFENRLTRPDFPSHLLQADPTVAYGCEASFAPVSAACARFLGTLTRAQLDDPDNPYNTYEHAGLPPGPICNPGLDALRAALHPAKVPYLYFVMGAGGHHTFSATLEEHERAVARYRAGR